MSEPTVMSKSASTSSSSSDGELEDPAAEAYLEHLLKDGAKEGDSGAELEMPSYYDEDKFRKGQLFMEKYRFVIRSGMFSGLIAVLAIPSILRILMCTRQSSTNATAYQRYLRTTLHTMSWYNDSPKEKSSKFWSSIKAVRQAHLRSSRACDKLRAGQITQKDLALTQFGFIGFLLCGAHRIQLYDEEFFECTAHMWRVLGYLLGIKEEYNICAPTWAETKKRLEIVMRKVYAPALQNTGPDFEKMTKALVEGLWPVNTTLTVGSFLFFTKRLAYVKGYEYYDFDARPGTKLDKTQKRYYNDLGLWDRFLVCYGLFLVTYLYKYDIVRWYLNLRVQINDFFMVYFPYVAFWKYGIKAAYVRIFTNRGENKEFEFHLKEE